MICSRRSEYRVFRREGLVEVIATGSQSRADEATKDSTRAKHKDDDEEKVKRQEGLDTIEFKEIKITACRGPALKLLPVRCVGTSDLGVVESEGGQVRHQGELVRDLARHRVVVVD